MIRKYLRTFLFVLAPLYLALVLHVTQGSHWVSLPLGGVNRAALGLSTPLLKGWRSLRDAVALAYHRYLNLIHIEEENEELKRLMTNYEVQHLFYEQVLEENRRLRAVVDFEEAQPFRTVVARVLSYPPIGEFRLMTVDRGGDDGVLRGAPVLAPAGLVGRLVRVERRISQVLLLVDPTSAVDVRVARTGARGLVVGRGEDGALEFWDRAGEIREGDLLIASGLDGVFPGDLPVGRVRSLEKGSRGIFLEGDMVPAVAFKKLREVFILVGR